MVPYNVSSKSYSHYKMTRPPYLDRRRRGFRKSTDSRQIWYTGVFEIADHESEVRFQKFKMADPIWLTCHLKMAITFGRNIVRHHSKVHFEGKE